MVCLYIFLIVLVFVGLKVGKNKDYLSKDTTTAIKGIFVIVVFFSHYSGYVDLNSNWYDKLFASANSCIGQLMVVMFLFYSGYGIFTQIRRTGGEYIDTFLRHRFLPTWLQFAVCVTFFLIMDVAIGTISDYSVMHIIQAYIGWKSIGNSSWFMFITFALYLIVFISNKIFKSRPFYGLVCVSALSIALTFVLVFVKGPIWWNTLLCFPLGMWFSYYKDWIDKHIFINRYIVALVSLLLIFGVLWFVDSKIHSLGVGYILLAMTFALLIVTVSMRVNVGNRVLLFFGKHIFSIYILQRLPLIIFQKYIDNIYLYFAVSFVVTIILSWLFDYISNQIRKRIANTQHNKQKTGV